MTKSDIRSEMIMRRKQQNEQEKLLKNKTIIEQIKNHHAYICAKSVALFYPMKDEVNLLELLNEKKTFLFPRVRKDKMDFYIYHQDIKWTKSKFGVTEPDQTETTYQKTIDLMIVPALAISMDKDRVGYGKGYYDQYISHHDITYTLGVIFDFQEVKYIKSTPNDQRLDDYIKGTL